MFQERKSGPTIEAFGADGFEIFGPEKVDTYELGGKASWRGCR